MSRFYDGSSILQVLASTSRPLTLSSITFTEQVDSTIATPAAGKVTIFGSSTDRIKRKRSDATYDTLVEENDLKSYLPLAGGTMTGALDMGSHAISNVTLLNGITAANLVSNPSTSTTGHIAVFADGTGKILTQSSFLPGSFLPLAGGVMTGAIVMGTNFIEVNQLSTDGIHGMYWGSGTSAANAQSLVVGNNSAGALDCLILGRNSSNVGTEATLVGLNNNNSAGDRTIAVGLSNLVSAHGAIAIGTDNTCSALNAVAIGSGLTNATANTVLIGNTPFQDLVNIRPQSDGTCDLGTSTERFNNVYLSGNVIGPGQCLFSLYPPNPVTVVNTTTLTSVLGAGLGSLTVAANSTQPGTLFKFIGSSRGNIDNGSSITFAIEVGGNIIGPTYTNASGGAQLGIAWLHDITFDIQSGGTVFVDWVINAFNGNANPNASSASLNMWDCTISNTIDFQVEWDTASLGNTVSQQYLTIERRF